MRRGVVIGVLCVCALGWAAPAEAKGTKPSARVAALQVALRAHGLYAARIDGVSGPRTQSGLIAFQRRKGLPATGHVGPRTRRAFGALGKPLLGERELWRGLVGWDVSSLEFRLRRLGLGPGKVDGVFTRATERALRTFQRNSGLRPDGILGRHTIRALAHASRPAPRPLPIHVVEPGESFFSIAQRFHVSPWQLARVNGLRLTGVIVPGQRLRLPAGARVRGTSSAPRGSIPAEIDHWSSVYGVDAKLARALAWMESGFQQHVRSSVGAEGVMQLLPSTWEYVETSLIRQQVPHTADGNVRVGLAYLSHLLKTFGGNERLALAGWYQGERAVRKHGLYDETKPFVEDVLALRTRM
jgi:peptidoglycan hydrolase-like protein with peptidoglycan-binding domain